MDNSQEEVPNKLDLNMRNPDGTLKPGHAPLPGSGRPPGQTLKEYWKERFKNMTDEEKIEFSRKVGNVDIWKMAEGLPKADINVDAKLSIANVISEIENGNNQNISGGEINKPVIEVIGQVVADIAAIQNQEQEQGTDNIPQEPSPAALPPEQVVEKYNPEEPSTGIHD